VALAAAACMVWFVWLTRSTWRSHATALLGAALLIGFVVIRVASIDRMDEWVGIPLTASRARWVLELGGIACIAISAMKPGPSRRE
jgi:hypothetical protein